MKMSLSKSQKKLLLTIIAGAVMFIAALVAEHMFPTSASYIVLLTVSYIILGHKVMLAAIKNTKKGKVFDEKFLMCIATMGAYILGDYTECVAVMLFYQIGEFFQSYAVAKSRKSVKDLMDICPEYANLEKDGAISEVSPFEVEINDIIVIKPGERVPLDGVVTDGCSSLDMTSLTGESLPKMADCGDTVLSGSINLTNTLRLKVTKTFENSTVSKIMELVESSGFNKAKSEQFITRFALWYTPLVVAAAAVTAFVPPLFMGGFALWLKRALIFLVISCPCALVISVPLSFFAAIGCASKHGILIKGANYLEQLGKAGTIVFDKTGTLTGAKFAISEVIPTDCNADELMELAKIAEFYSDHPVAKCINGEQSLKNYRDIQSFEDIAGLGVSAVYKGKKIYAGSKALMKKCGIEISESAKAGVTVHVCADKKYMGCIIVADTIKSEAKDAINRLRKNGIQTCMLTGDTEKNALPTADELGIDKVYASLLPQDKVQKLKDMINSNTNGKKSVAYVGDGINDAPVIAMADVGIAMGSLGSDAAIEAADIVICDDNLSKLPLAINLCKKTNAIVRQNVVFSIGTKLMVMLLAALGYANMWAAVFADVGVAFVAILNAMRAFKIK